ncbi:Isochorismatase hydrolase [Ascobolus immersus RN42]|uniref:Isochorismatase hydrolase n=1 Tax=Ascobolus immersus RN42 TaxID=1160509 RepID=A0A3N4IP23_ASCIM|nr:Isochorismatase hydrolase [Ascobolus immersus RN42]
MVIANPVLLVCDIQEAFRSSIYEYPSVISTANKVVRASQILKVPHYVTTQMAAKLKPTVRELSVNTFSGSWDKTKFSMAVPPLVNALSDLAKERGVASLDIAIVGIEAHVCVLQTVMDLRKLGHNVWVLADGVSSSSLGEVKVAIERMKSVGAVISTSESWIFEVMGDANVAGFKEIQQLIKEDGIKWSSKHALEKLVAKI